MDNNQATHPSPSEPPATLRAPEKPDADTRLTHWALPYTPVPSLPQLPASPAPSNALGLVRHDLPAIWSSPFTAAASSTGSSPFFRSSFSTPQLASHWTPRPPSTGTTETFSPPSTGQDLVSPAQTGLPWWQAQADGEHTLPDIRSNPQPYKLQHQLRWHFTCIGPYRLTMVTQPLRRPSWRQLSEQWILSRALLGTHDP